MQIDDRTNTLIITDLPGKLDTASALLSTLDRAEPQVEVEARIVQTTRDFARAVGIQWGLNGRVMPDVGNTTSLAFPNQGTLGGRLGSQGSTDPRASATEQTSTAVNLGVPDANSAIGLALGAVNGAFNLDVALSALERTGKGRVLSTPRLTTQNNIEAEVAQGIQIPIQTVANNTVTVSFKDAALVAQGHAADHRGQHRDHEDHASRTRRPTSAVRSTASRRSTRSAPTRRCRSTTGRRRSSAASS